MNLNQLLLKDVMKLKGLNTEVVSKNTACSEVDSIELSSDYESKFFVDFTQEKIPTIGLVIYDGVGMTKGDGIPAVWRKVDGSKGVEFHLFNHTIQITSVDNIIQIDAPGFDTVNFDKNEPSAKANAAEYVEWLRRQIAISNAKQPGFTKLLNKRVSFYKNLQASKVR